MVKRYSLEMDGDEQISSHFKVKEFRCKDNSDAIYIDVDLVLEKLELIRTHFDLPVIITSGYRTEKWNKLCGGASKSYHLQGKAFDITIKGIEPLTIARFASEIEVNGIISYTKQGFCHIDSRTSRYWAINNGGRISVKNKF
jgi:uncharacterized protein YcbK (DUF882 family)